MHIHVKSKSWRQTAAESKRPETTIDRNTCKALENSNEKEEIDKNIEVWEKKEEVEKEPEGTHSVDTIREDLLEELIKCHARNGKTKNKKVTKQKDTLAE